MVLLLDLGNTNLYCGVYQDDVLLCEFRTHSDTNKSSDEYAQILGDFLKNYNLKKSEFEGAILSSVVPALGTTLIYAVKKLLGIDCMLVGKNLKSRIAIHIDNPNELGSDLLADSVGGKDSYNYPLIICDLGTATKLIVIDKEGHIVGCIIAPGIKISMKALSNNAAQLTDTSLVAPMHVIGKNSSDSINSGIIYGTIEMIEGLSRRIEEELGYKCKKIITGGNAILVKDKMDKEYIYDSNLILRGLYSIYKMNR